jgi:hypothetical protein
VRPGTKLTGTRGEPPTGPGVDRARVDGKTTDHVSHVEKRL